MYTPGLRAQGSELRAQELGIGGANCRQLRPENPLQSIQEATAKGLEMLRGLTGLKKGQGLRRPKRPRKLLPRWIRPWSRA